MMDVNRIVTDLTLLRDKTQEILTLDLISGNDDEKLLDLQLQQKEIMSRISMPESFEQLPSEISLLVQECIHLEKVANKRLRESLEDINMLIEQAKGGRKARSAYQSEQPQYEGYFIDKQR